MAQEIVYVPPTPLGFDVLAHSHGVVDAMGDATEIGRAYAESIAPRLTGDYAEKFEVSTDGGEVQLVNTSDHAIYVEWHDNFHVLAQAADRIEGGL
jgi:hypothetical protein